MIFFFQDTAFHLVRYFTDLSQLSVQDDLPANKDAPTSIPCASSIEGDLDESDIPLGGSVDNLQKEIFFKEINFSPDLTIRIDYQVFINDSRSFSTKFLSNVRLFIYFSKVLASFYVVRSPKLNLISP